MLSDHGGGRPEWPANRRRAVLLAPLPQPRSHAIPEGCCSSLARPPRRKWRNAAIASSFLRPSVPSPVHFCDSDGAQQTNATEGTPQEGGDQGWIDQLLGPPPESAEYEEINNEETVLPLGTSGHF